MNEVTAWLVDDRVTTRGVADLYALLDHDERRRADCKDTEDGRRRFVVAHGAVRRIAGEYLGAPPGELTWRIGRHGKPELDGRWTGVEVNLSHSGGLCLIALSDKRAVGVDVQRHVPGLAVVAMARRYFAPQEAESVAEADDPVETFARLWARKEAVSKAAGGRLTQILPLPTTDHAVVETPSSAYRVLDLGTGIPAGFRAAVACEGRAPFSVDLVPWRP
ncbi:4'-phosphopantetheinyl transferase family protein [Catenulispora subtropica]|uniref:4'-phosphopantetheinyl transferase domain-containing protein n=1 Tax=Catenulispora subtropica TaxID=450798 RepID=A0ABN2SDA0_9ACTN